MSIKSLQDEIKSLEVFFDQKDCNQEAVIFTIKTLNEVLETLSKQNWDSVTIVDYVLSDNDPLDKIDGVSDMFRENVREVQHGIINYFL